MVELIISKASNSKSFVGNISFPSGRKGKQIEVRIGSYGKGINEFTLLGLVKEGINNSI